MFTFLGKSVAKHPLKYVLCWAILLLFGFSTAISGFGYGNIFQRIESSTSLVPGSDSDVVSQKTAPREIGATLTAIIDGVSLTQAKDSLMAFREKIEKISTVKELHDPVQLSTDFHATLAQEKEKAVHEALTAAKPQIDAAVAAALQAQQQSLAQLPAPLRAAAEKEIVEKAQKTASTQVTDTATQKIDAQLAQLHNPATAFTPEKDPQGTTGFAIVTKLKPNATVTDETKIQDIFHEYEKELIATGAENARVLVLSTAIIQKSILNQVTADLVRGEAVGLPIALILMILVFGGLLAASLPLSAAIISIAIAMSIIWSITFLTNVDSFVLNIITIIGLALSIDYGLLVVSRYREIVQRALQEQNFSITDFCREKRQRNSTKAAALATKQKEQQLKEIISAAIAETVVTAGRTVSFSAITIVVAVAGLFLIDAPMIQMIAAGGVVVTLFAVFTAVTFVPAGIKLLGKKLLKPSPLRRIPGFAFLFHVFGDAPRTGTGIFSTLAKWVHARPWRVLLSISAILLVACLPLKDLQMRSNFLDYVPQDTQAAQALAKIDADYPAFQIPPISIYTAAPAAAIKNMQQEIAQIPGVKRVAEPNEIESGTVISVFPEATDAAGAQVTQIVQEIREMDFAQQVYVGGGAAKQLDFRNEILAGALPAAAVIVLAVFTLLFLLTGSLMVPLKALIINTLSLGAAMGITVFIFENGLLRMPTSLGLETFIVACAAAFGFGLAMDYEVFLIARIKEYWDSGMSNDLSVEIGLQQSGRIITAAAAIIIAVFIGFSFGELLPIKQIGVALAVIVFVDATLVRMLLVPALMTLMGKWNWWAPKPLLKFYEKFKLVH